ncbi:hypothetical protein TwortDSMZ_198 [Staphylococcus phage Twort]|uniref:Uncharacterized protein n=2 Tax=Staphylococcus phage Twort (strain DSM 17442 / HER 48) TaxID=2908167 RepID=A0A6H0X5R0_BPTWO|nr:ORF200 [Staphylococcus phage Twort]AAX92459.1 ORF200 [Staphylococcus phage Twort]QIW89021.1 hypothetical protein TwortDSMZ_009 [Staphylococcus phage Twort]QIW89192.1 hypothetical protein TwortDSMZ_198 [Staphylococcus phage Twort]
MISSIIEFIVISIISVVSVGVFGFMWYAVFYTKDKVLLSVAILLTVILGLSGLGATLDYFGL